MQSPYVAAFARRLFIVVSAGLVPAALPCVGAAQSNDAPAGQESAVVALPDVVVSATRTPQSARVVPSSVTVFTAADWADAAADSLAELLRTAAGTGLVVTGVPGGQSTVFLRGAASHQTQFVVDGVRLNDRSALYQTYLGGADLGNVDRVEVLRGPQSGLYGGSAMGGVISVDTALGRGRPGAEVSVEAGSFDSLDTRLTVAGASGPLAFSVGGDYAESANDREANGFIRRSESARIEYRATSAVTVGGTFRRLETAYDEPGAVGPITTPGTVDFAHNLGTAFARYAAGAVRSQVTLSAQLRDYTFTSAYGATPVHQTRQGVAWQGTAALPGSVELTGGFEYEPSRQVVVGDTEKREQARALYVSAVWQMEEDMAVTASLRRDDYDSVGAHTTGRVGVSRWFSTTGTKLRATYGTAFTAPSLDDRYGNAAYWMPANASVRPEKSRGWDAGIDQTFARGKAQVGVTWFDNRYRDLFGYDALTYATTNIGRARTYGLENSVDWRVVPTVRVRAAYTWLEAEDTSTGARLVRRPRHAADAGATWQPVKGLSLGAGVLAVAGREEDSTNADYTTSRIDQEDYVTVRLNASWRVNDRLTVHARVENLLDESYAEVLGYPARGIGAFAGVALRF